MNPYTTLGVARDADDATIKSAYRSMAQAHHPDKEGGDEAKFKEVKEAYELLSDPERRKRYDDTGSTDAGVDYDSRLYQAFSQLLVSSADKIGDYDDLVKEMTRHLDGMLMQKAAEKASSERALKRRERALARMKRKADSNNRFSDIAHDILRSAIGDAKGHIAAMEADIKFMKDVREMTVQYQFTPDKEAPYATSGTYITGWDVS